MKAQTEVVVPLFPKVIRWWSLTFDQLGSELVPRQRP